MNPPGRFLKEDASDGFWYDIGDAKAIKKTGQALREDAPGIRNEIEQEYSSGEEGANTPPRQKATSDASTAAPTNVPVAGDALYEPPAPSGYAHGHGDGNAHQQQHWMPAGMHRQHSAPMAYSHHHGMSQLHYGQQNLQSSPNMYNMPATFYSGVRSSGNKFGKMSQTATEAMRHAAHHVGGGVPPNQVAFGRVFTPTVMSSGSTMSTISGLSGLSGNEQAARASQRTSGELRVSQLSDMTTSMMSLGSSLGLTRSNSLPELGLSKEFTSLSDASFAVLMEEEEGNHEGWEQAGVVMESELLRDSSGTGTSGSSGNRPPHLQGPAPPRTRTTSAVSAMSWASAGSQRSNLSSSMRSSAGSDTSWLNPVRSRLTGSIHSDHSFSSSTRYVQGLLC